MTDYINVPTVITRHSDGEIEAGNWLRSPSVWRYWASDEYDASDPAVVLTAKAVVEWLDANPSPPIYEVTLRVTLDDGQRDDVGAWSWKELFSDAGWAGTYEVIEVKRKDNT